MGFVSVNLQLDKFAIEVTAEATAPNSSVHLQAWESGMHHVFSDASFVPARFAMVVSIFYDLMMLLQLGASQGASTAGW